MQINSSAPNDKHTQARKAGKEGKPGFWKQAPFVSAFATVAMVVVPALASSGDVRTPHSSALPATAAAEISSVPRSAQTTTTASAETASLLRSAQPSETKNEEAAAPLSDKPLDELEVCGWNTTPGEGSDARAPAVKERSPSKAPVNAPDKKVTHFDVIRCSEGECRHGDGRGPLVKARDLPRRHDGTIIYRPYHTPYGNRVIDDGSRHPRYGHY